MGKEVHQTIRIGNSGSDKLKEKKKPATQSEAHKRARAKYNKSIQTAKRRAREFFLESIIELSAPDKNRYNGIMFYVAIWKYSRLVSVPPRRIILLMMIDYHKNTSVKEIYPWGMYLHTSRIGADLKYVEEHGYVEYIRSRFKLYFLSIKGRKLLDEYYKFYDNLVKQQKAYNATGNKNIISKKANKVDREGD